MQGLFRSTGSCGLHDTILTLSVVFACLQIINNATFTCCTNYSGIVSNNMSEVNLNIVGFLWFRIFWNFREDRGSRISS